MLNAKISGWGQLEVDINLQRRQRVKQKLAPSDKVTPPDFPSVAKPFGKASEGIFRKGQRMQCLRALPCDDLSSAHN